MAKKKKICRHCGEPMVKTAKICPNCGGKNPVPFFSRWYVWAIILILISSFFRWAAGDPAEIEHDYISTTVDELYEELEDNALKAEDEYMDAYVEVTGKLDVIDSDGEYIGLYPIDEEYTLDGIHCTLTSDAQRESLKKHSRGDIITVKGQITDVGEVLGFHMRAIDIY